MTSAHDFTVGNRAFAHTLGENCYLRAVPLGEARNLLSEYVADVERTHERVTITRHDRAAAVLISADDLVSIEETLEIPGAPGAVEVIKEGPADGVCHDCRSARPGGCSQRSCGWSR